MSHATDGLSLVDRLALHGGCTDDCPPLGMTKAGGDNRLVFTHGNPEHRLGVPLHAVLDAWEHRVVDWLLRLHAYEARVGDYERCGVPE